MHRIQSSILVIFLAASLANSQSSPEQVQPILSQAIQSADVTAYLLREYALRHVPRLPTAQNAAQWASEATRIRRHLLDDVVFHGWPTEWVNSPPRFEETGVIETGKGYRMRKLRYEIVPSFASAAILYEPEILHGKVPAILNVHGHVGAEGKAIEYEQKRCINFAKRGMLALNLEWLGTGELAQAQNDHDFAAHLELVGVNGLGFFYLAMRKGLDYFYDHPQVDRHRLAVTGLSGGGWQTIVLSSLDERVGVAIPAAGFSALTSSAEHPEDSNDIEQNAADFRDGHDYTFLVAVRAPRPTLLIYNVEDDCCFRAPLVRSYIYDDIKPFFRLFGKEDALAWHENLDPGTHNYQVDNRQTAYRFLNQWFNLTGPDQEIPVDSEIKSYDDLVVGLPKDNLTILRLARRIASGIQHQPIPSVGHERANWINSERAHLKSLVRYSPVTITHAWAITNTKHGGVETRSYRFDLSEGLSATGVWLKAIRVPDNSPRTIVLNDNGKQGAANEVCARVNRGEQVLALDLLFFGDASLAKSTPAFYTQLLGAIGNRPIGIEAAQLNAVAHWFQGHSPGSDIRLQTVGIRSQSVALVASALDSTLSAQLVTQGGMRSLRFLLDKPVIYDDAPDLFCLDLYRELDLPGLAVLSEPTKVTESAFVEAFSN